jgi:hypothetical protein
MPEKAQMVANSLVTTIEVVEPTDPRLRLGYTKEPRAALVGDTLIISCGEDMRELWHEVGHAIVDRGLAPDERKVIGKFYDFSKGLRSPEEILAEDFYFTLQGNKSSPFWTWWFEPHSTRGSRKTELERTATRISPLDIVEAVLDAFAEELVYEHGNEEHVIYYGIAKDALKDAQKEDRFSYENRFAPHQYYFAEDLVSPPPHRRLTREPLKVERPDWTMRGVTPFGLGMV